MEYVFYCSCVVGILLYLPVILAVLLNRSVHHCFQPLSDTHTGVLGYLLMSSSFLTHHTHTHTLTRSLRVLPLKQCLAHISASQSLSLLVSAVSYHLHTPPQLCYSLAVLTHYTSLVALVWLAVYPVMAAMKVFRRTWFEKWWMLVPVAVASWGECVCVCVCVCVCE